jgi:hypothetical protein
VKSIFNLPLNPSNINITTHFATNIISTMGGTVEEHAPQSYFDISISGTTVVAPRYSAEQTVGAPVQQATQGRSAYTADFSVGSLTGGFFAKTTGQLDSALNRARDILGGARKQESGVYPAASGYIAFHNFYKFLLQNKSHLAQGGSSSGSITSRVSGALGKGIQPLQFLSYKDNQQYTCAILRFELTRSVDNPMLYNYSIQLRAYALSSIGSDNQQSLGDNRLILLGLGDDSSLLSSFKNKVSGAKAGISAVSGAFKTLGR